MARSILESLPRLLCLAITLGIIAIGALACAPSTDGTVSSSGSGEPRAAIIDQLYSLQPNEVFVSETTQQLEAYGFVVDLYQGNEITVDLYRQLPSYGYSLIIFRAHSGLIGSEGEITKRTCLFTNENYSETKHVTEQLADQLAMARIDEYHPWVFGIGDEFVTRSMEGQFDNTVIIMMGCSTLYLEDLGQSFVQKGASTYLGWDAAVSLGYVDQATPVLLANLYDKQMTIKKAVDETMAVNGPDPDYGAFLKYYPIDSGNKTIRALIR
ncbi:hypothetical protein ACFL4C_03845 [Candidatus Omnitrophota bacterium]